MRKIEFRSRRMGIHLIAERKIVLLLLMVVLSSLVHSQQPGKSASLRGTVRDSRGKRVAGATLGLQSDAKTQAAQADAVGNYSFTAVPEGGYVLRVSMAGYADT